jgi:hypothetical protein
MTLSLLPCQDISFAADNLFSSPVNILVCNIFQESNPVQSLARHALLHPNFFTGAVAFPYHVLAPAGLHTVDFR